MFIGRFTYQVFTAGANEVIQRRQLKEFKHDEYKAETLKEVQRYFWDVFHKNKGIYHHYTFVNGQITDKSTGRTWECDSYGKKKEDTHMKAFKGYDETKAYGSGMEQLPKGGYVCKIMKASVESSQYGEQLVIALDIVEGDYKDFFANEYRAQDREDKKWHGNYYLSIPTDDGSEKDGWTKRKFKTFTNAVEDSNAGYTWNWDENTLKGKLFGGLFIGKERLYQGKIYTSTICGGATSIGAIKEGKYKLPKDRPVKNAPAGTRSASDTGSDFISVPEGAGEEGLPF